MCHIAGIESSNNILYEYKVRPNLEKKYLLYLPSIPVSYSKVENFYVG